MEDEERTNSEIVPVDTCGELFADNGDSLDLLRDGRLLQTSAAEPVISPTIHRDGRQYTATPLTPTLASTLHLPERVEDHVSTVWLFQQLHDAVQQHTGLNDSQAFRCTAYTLGTHLAGALRLPMMNVWGDASCDAPVTQWFSVACRRPLPLAETSFHDLLELPSGLMPTLILPQPKETLLRHLRTATGTVGYASLHKGALAHFQCSAVVCTTRPLPFSCLPISLVTDGSALRRISAAKLEELAQEFQPLCLSFRASTWQQAQQSQFDAPQFTPSVRLLARSLGAVLEGAPSLQQRLLAVLTELDQQQRGQQSQGVAALVAYALLEAVHRAQTSVYVHDLADAVNLGLEARHESGRLTPKGMGTVLREELGLTTKRASDGYQVILDATASALIHEMAATAGIDSSVGSDGCHGCERYQQAVFAPSAGDAA